MLCPRWKFTAEVSGLARPAGQTVRYPPATGSTAVTVSTAAAAPSGTSAFPATCIVTVPEGDTECETCCAERESAIRVGGTEARAPVAVGVPARM